MAKIMLAVKAATYHNLHAQCTVFKRYGRKRIVNEHLPDFELRKLDA